MRETSTALFCLALLVISVAASAAGNNFLLTNNGVANDEFSEYKNAQRIDLQGGYEVAPDAEGLAEGVRVSFAEGAFTNGDSSFNFRRKPGPYSYWQQARRGELLIHLNRVCRIDRLRVCLLSPAEGPHGTESIEVLMKGDPLEFPDVLRVGTIAPATDGWNEMEINRKGDGLRLMFTAGKGKTYITVSEVEIWGEPLEDAPPASVLQSDQPKRTEDGVTWWAFDFGPEGSPSFARFHVTGAAAAYSPDKGFGWIPYENGQPVIESNFGPSSTAVPGLGERDRGSVTDPLYRDLVMTSEYYHTQVRQTFAVDVPNGQYRVVTLHGDPVFGNKGRQSFWIEAEGAPVAEDIEYNWSRLAEATFDVQVADGRLDITLDGAHEDPAKKGFAINGMMVLPLDTDEHRTFADRKISLMHAALDRYREEAFARDFAEVPHEETAEMVQPTDVDTQRGFIGWSPNWMDRLFPNSVPEKADVRRACATFATPGEYEPVAIAMRALQDLAGVRVQVSELRSDGATIPASAIEVRKVTCWPQRIGSSWSKDYQTMPELLELFESVDLPANTTQEFWLTIHVPADTAPGLYSGAVRILAGTDREWETELRLRVLPFDLAPAERTVGMYWRDEKWEPERLDRQIADMLAHGITTVTLGRTVDMSMVDGRLVVDTSDLLSFLQHLKKLGITGPIPYWGGLEGRVRRAFPDADQDALILEAIRQLQAISARDDTPQLLFYPVDEIGNSDERGEMANRMCSLVAKVPGAASYITVNNYAAGEKWGDPFDIWCGNIEYTADQEQRLLARDKRYMRYGPAYLNSCRQARNSSGFGFYRRPAEAHYYWHYQCFNGDPFDDFDGTARDWCAAYPGPDGPIPTLDWEAIREGIDDMRYIATLKALAAKAGEGSATQKQVAATALEELSAVLAMEGGVNQYSFAESLSADDFDRLRWRLADQILKLDEAL